MRQSKNTPYDWDPRFPKTVEHPRQFGRAVWPGGYSHWMEVHEVGIIAKEHVGGKIMLGYFSNLPDALAYNDAP